MTQIDERTARVERAIAEIKTHPMCGEFQDLETCFRVIYPAGDFPVGGLQSVVKRGEGRAIALEKLLPIMERHWVESYPGANQ